MDDRIRTIEGPKKRGILRGVAKYKIKSKALKAKEGERTLLSIGLSVYFSLGRKCFEFGFYCCGKLYLAPFTRTERGEYVSLDRKSKLIHYFVWFVKFLVLLHKLVGLVVMLLHVELKMEAFMCASHFLIYFFSFSISLGMIARPKETMDLLNGSLFILSCLKEHRGFAPSQCDDLSTSLKLIAVLVTTQGIALAAPLFTLPFSTLPTGLFDSVESLDLLPEGLLSRFTWKPIFLPLEYLTYLPPMFSAPFAGSFLLILAGVHKMVGYEIRKIKIHQLQSCKAQYFLSVPTHERKQAMKRAKAMRVLEFPIGGFADFSINSPITIWDEVLNQVLFLLSL